MTDYDSQLAILLAMSDAERSVYCLQEKVDSEQYWLEVMLAEWRERARPIQQIREQRKRVQLWRTRLNAAKAKLAKS